MSEEIGRFAVVITIEGPLEAAHSLRKQIELFTLGGVPFEGVEHVTLHRNMMLDAVRPYEPWVLVEPEDLPEGYIQSEGVS